MNRRIRAAVFAAAAILPTACDEAGSHPPIAVDKLPPLSAEDIQQIKDADAKIEAEERGTPVYATGKGKKKGGTPAKAPADEQ